MAKKKYSYKEAIQEIETIIGSIEHEEIDVDTLSEKVKKISSLIVTCKSKLKTTEEEIDTILKNIP